MPGSFSVPVAMKSFYRADRVDLLWSSSGSHLIVFMRSDEDKTGKSYYGETGIIFLSCDGKLSCNVSLDTDGPIHDVSWNPSRNEFVVVHGCEQVHIRTHPLLDANLRFLFTF